MLKAKKDKIRVITFTDRFRIEGDIHLYENSRLSDILNAESSKDFVALTNVKIFSMEDQLLYTKDFLALNKQHVVLVILDESSHEAARTSLASARDMLTKKNWKAAHDEAQKSIIIDPDNAEAHYILGMALGKMNFLNEALSEFETALSLAPTTSEISRLSQEMMNQIRI